MRHVCGTTHPRGRPYRQRSCVRPRECVISGTCRWSPAPIDLRTFIADG